MSMIASRHLRLPLPSGIHVPQLLYGGDGFELLYKPPGMAVQADERGDVDLMTWRGRNEAPVGRLDRPAAGIVLAAYSREARSLLQTAQQAGEFTKIYCARTAPGSAILPETLSHNWRWVNGRAESNQGTGGKPALAKVLSQNNDLVTIQLITGRRHQIRSTLAREGAPILGDPRYGGPKSGHLHLACVELVFPVRGGTLRAGLDRSALFALNLAG